MRFSVWPSFQRPWEEVLHLALHAEAAGWHGLWYADHFMPDTPDGTPSSEPALECWTVLPALAAATQRLRLGTLVSPTSVRHPAVLAKQAATADRISDGRVVLGIGAGWQVNEHRAYGIDLAEPKVRVDRFAEALQVITSLLSEPSTTFEGAHFRLVDAPCEPKPVQQPLPVMVGTPSPRMMRLTARHAHEWNVWGTPERVADRTAAFLAACEKEGRDPATVRRSVQALFFLVDDEERAAMIRERAPDDRSVVGGPEQLVEAIGRYQELGVDEVIVPDFTLGSTAAERQMSYDRFAAEVTAAFT